jgi:hypothetical protein
MFGGEQMLEKLGLATAITFSLYLLVKVPTPTGAKLGGHPTFANQLISAKPQQFSAWPRP